MMQRIQRILQGDMEGVVQEKTNIVVSELFGFR